MKRMKKLIIGLLIGFMTFAVFEVTAPVGVFAHSGRTDANGGHKDNKNKSGLGPYHYHCGGYPAHLHPNGVCPYTSSADNIEEEPRENISIESAPSEMYVGDSEIIKYIIENQEGSSNVKMTSDRPEVVSVEKGRLKAVGEGTAVITVQTDHSEVSVEIHVSSISVESFVLEEQTRIQTGETRQLKYQIEPPNATDRSISWESEDRTIASVDSFGNITGEKVGKTQITAIMSNGLTGSCEVEVYEIVSQEIWTNFQTLEMTVGDIQKLDIKVLPENAADLSYLIDVQDDTILSIGKDNQIQAIRGGSTKIVIQTANLKKELPVQIKEIEVNSIIIQDQYFQPVQEQTIDIQDELQLFAVVYPENASTKKIKWISDNMDVVSTEENRLQIKGEGTVTLTASVDNGVSEKVVIHIIDKERKYASPVLGCIVIAGGLGATLAYRKRKEKV